MDLLTAIGIQQQTNEPAAAPPLDAAADAQGPLSFQSLLTRLKLSPPSKPGLPASTTEKMAAEQENDLTDPAQASTLNALPIESLVPGLPGALFQPVAQDTHTSAGEPALKQPTIGLPAALFQPVAQDTHTSAGEAPLEQPTIREPVEDKRPQEIPVQMRDAAALTDAGKFGQPTAESGTAAKPLEAANFAVPAPALPPAASAALKNTHDAPDPTLASALTVATPMPQPIAVTPAHETPAATAQLAAQVGSPIWGNELGQRLVLMVGAKQHVAELHLNPPHLGPLDVTLTIDGSQTSAVFTSPHSAVRDLISAEMPRLREILADSGITLGNASVTADTPRDGAAYASASQSRRGASADGASAETGSPLDADAPITRRIGLVDLFA